MCKRARFELPQTNVIGKLLTTTDEFGKGMIEAMEIQFMSNSFTATTGDDDDEEDDEEAEEPDVKKRKLDDDPEVAEDEMLNVSEASNGESGLQLIEEDETQTMDVDHDAEAIKDAIADNVDINGADVNLFPGWGSNDSHGGWGASNTGGTWAAQEDSNIAWAGKVDELNTWGAQPDYSGWLPEISKGVYRLLGAMTLLPLTHTTGIVEQSVRRIARVIPPTGVVPVPVHADKGSKSTGDVHPAAAVEEDFVQRLAQVVFAPWVKVGNHIGSDIIPPSLLPGSRGHVVSGPYKAKPAAVAPPTAVGSASRPFDPSRDEIVVLVDPAIADKLTPGMGIRGSWVQITRVDTTYTGNKWTGKQRNSKERKGPIGMNGEPTKWWYLDNAFGVFVSFHSDMYYPNQAS